jgi:adenylylsulfate kinase
LTLLDPKDAPVLTLNQHLSGFGRCRAWVAKDAPDGLGRPAPTVKPTFSSFLFPLFSYLCILEVLMSKGTLIWLTGLSGAGKTTITQALAPRLSALGHRVEILDGDVVRETLSKGLGFSKEDRDTNILRIGFVANLLAKHGVTVLVSAISPYRDARREVLLEATKNGTRALEVFVDAPLEVVSARDVKGLYKKALEGEIKHFTGVSDPYEAPLEPDVHIRTDLLTLEQSVAAILEKL